MNSSESTSNLLKALVEAAPELTAISKSKQAYGYKYATLDSRIDMLRSVLPKHGLWFMQMPTRSNDSSVLTTRVFHTSGEWIEDSIQMTETTLQGKVNDTQRLGASITYFRRYALSAIFGVAADEDVDGNIEQPRSKPAEPPVRAQEKPQQSPEDKKRKAADFLKADYLNRISHGETVMSIMKDYADLLKTDQKRSPSEMSDDEVIILSRALYARARSTSANVVQNEP